MQVLKINKISEIKLYFKNYFGLYKIKNNKIDNDEFNNFVESKKFNHLYKNIISEIVDQKKFDKKKICIQDKPTFRKYIPNAHGTSFHNDYLYGHGKKTYTFWVPLYGLSKLNSVYFLKKKFAKNFELKKLGAGYSNELEKELIKQSETPILKNNEIISFNSSIIHGSPKNLSSQTRYSFEFRISSIGDKTSTKKTYNYLYYDQEWKKKNIFHGKKFLKYICGGKSTDTTAQHMMIDKMSLIYDINIVAKEAEVERYKFEILKQNIQGKIKNKEYNSIIIASESILDSKIKKLINLSNMKVYAVLGGKYLN